MQANITRFFTRPANTQPPAASATTPSSATSQPSVILTQPTTTTTTTRRPKRRRAASARSSDSADSAAVPVPRIIVSPVRGTALESQSRRITRARTRSERSEHCVVDTAAASSASAASAGTAPESSATPDVPVASQTAAQHSMDDIRSFSIHQTLIRRTPFATQRLIEAVTPLFAYLKPRLRLDASDKFNIYTMSINHSGTALAAAGAEGRLSVYDITAAHGQRGPVPQHHDIGVDYGIGIGDQVVMPLQSFVAHSRWVSGVQFVSNAAENEVLLSSSDDGSIAAWSLANCDKPLFRDRDLHSSGVFHIHLLRGHLLSASKDETCAMSDLLPTGLKIVRRFSGHHNGVVKCAQWRNCANVLASCGNDKLIHVYDVRAPDPIHTFAGYHECAVNSVSWDPSCEFRFLSAAFDTKINVFDMRMPAEQLHVYILLYCTNRGCE
eukprot:TRINITY_DN1172_c0_g1_i6.p1 TRINITY_DN1172_c0_g1~~TRINITY_DN1172_c0_g1_i6.p1  ORF type:complete len:440 (-),score=93.98 TRINITY_DN1172_c0_g1_i6:464-1783(-)